MGLGHSITIWRNQWRNGTNLDMIMYPGFLLTSWIFSCSIDFPDAGEINSPTYFKMTSSNGSIFRVTGLLCGEFTGLRWIPTQRPVTQSFDIFFHLRLNQQLNKQWRDRSLRRHYVHYDVVVMNKIRSCFCTLEYSTLPYYWHALT